MLLPLLHYRKLANEMSDPRPPRQPSTYMHAPSKSSISPLCEEILLHRCCGCREDSALVRCDAIARPGSITGSCFPMPWKNICENL